MGPDITHLKVNVLPKLRFRNGNVGDAVAISTLGSHVFAYSFSNLMPCDDLAAYLARSYSVASIAADLENPAVTFIVVEKDDTIIGFAQLKRGASTQCIDDIDNKIQLKRLYVSEKYQGLGIGKSLLAKAEEKSTSMGFANIWLASWELNPKAGDMYGRAGYIIHGEMSFELGSSSLKDWVMVKPLQ